MSTAVMQELVQELESRSIALPSESGILNKCTLSQQCHADTGGMARCLTACFAGRDALVRASASVDDVASTIEAVMMNNNSNEITDAIVAQVVMSLVRAASLVGVAATPLTPALSPLTEQSRRQTHGGQIRHTQGTHARTAVHKEQRGAAAGLRLLQLRGGLQRQDRRRTVGTWWCHAYHGEASARSPCTHHAPSYRCNRVTHHARAWCGCQAQGTARHGVAAAGIEQGQAADGSWRHAGLDR